MDCSQPLFLHSPSTCQQKRNRNHLLSTCWVLLSPTSHVCVSTRLQKDVLMTAHVPRTRKKPSCGEQLSKMTPVPSPLFVLVSMAEKRWRTAHNYRPQETLPRKGKKHSTRAWRTTSALAAGSLDSPSSFSISPILGPLPSPPKKKSTFPAPSRAQRLRPHFTASNQS